MKQSDIKAEKDRLHDIVFEGVHNAIESFDEVYAAMDKDGEWWWFYIYFDFHDYVDEWVCHAGEDNCKNQPETTLDWTDTLIKRKVNKSERVE